jgi:hypothetical protein
VRGIAASVDATTLVVSSDRGIYRSEDRGETWAAKEDNLPIHIEAGPLARDPNDAGVVYVVFSLIPYAEVWRMAIEGRNVLARIELLRRGTCRAGAPPPIRRADSGMAAGAVNLKFARYRTAMTAETFAFKSGTGIVICHCPYRFRSSYGVYRECLRNSESGHWP